MIGKSFKDLKEERIAEGVKSSKIESPGYEQFCIYFARAHLGDHETNIVARGPLKIGRAKYMTTIARGRNQSGIDFRTYARIIVKTNDETWMLEKEIKNMLEHKHAPGSQGQQELYNLTDSELRTFLNTFNMKMPSSAKMRIYF